MFDHIEAFYRPTTLPEAIRLLQKIKGKARIVAGGSDLIVSGDRSVRSLIDITRAGLSYVHKQGRTIAIGATARLADIEEAAPILGLAGGILAHAAATCGSIQNRNMATLGGNLANASPAADTVVPLLVLDASVVMADSRGQRAIPLEEFLTIAHRSRFAKSILVEVTIPLPPNGKRCGWAFQKLGRTAVDISLVNLAAGLEVDGKGRVKWVRLAVGAAAPSPLRVTEAERLMTGRVLDHALVEEAAAAVRSAVDPISDVRASAEYRREMSGVLAVRALEACAVEAGCSL